MFNAEFWTKLVPFATVVSAGAAALALIVGAVSLVLLMRQTRAASQTALLTTAFDAHKEYIKLCIEYPELSSSEMMLQHLKRDNFSGIFEDTTPKVEKALWFISYVLFAMEQLALSSSKEGIVDPAWEATIVDQLGYHRALLIEAWPEWKHHYSPIMDNLVQTAITHLPAQPSSGPT